MSFNKNSTIKVTPWDGMCEAVYPAHHDFIFVHFFRFLKTNKNPRKTQHTICTPKGWLIIGPYVDAAGPVLGRQSVLLVSPPPFSFSVLLNFFRFVCML